MGKLGDKEIKAAKASDKQQKLSDGDGLILVVRTSGKKLWQLRYRFGGKEKTLSLGEYPLVPLITARENAFKARQSIREGIDPSAAKQAAKAALVEQADQKKQDAGTAFEVVAREWFEKYRKSNDWEDNHASKILGRLEKDIFPWLGKRPIKEITAPELLSVIRRIENRGALETAHRALSECGRVFRYAVACGIAERDPSGDLKGALPPYKKNNHFAAITDTNLVGDLLRDIEGYSGTTIVRCAFALSPRLFLRPGELRKLEWIWIDFDEGIITIPSHAHKTGKKTQAPHLVPLSRESFK
jgi:Arm DNA-binding domain